MNVHACCIIFWSVKTILHMWTEEKMSRAEIRSMRLQLKLKKLTDYWLQMDQYYKDPNGCNNHINVPIIKS